METTLKRLYVGGIGPSVTNAELADRFGKFGKVNDVDIISRKDEQGNPIKTFAYLNINISDTDLKKCVSVLNKAKWKGGVLQIEMAKESFLHRLSQERQAAKEKESPKVQSHSQHDMVQSLQKAGVTDFQMKAAVPGTEIPNHKNWVVSKYGRVLPVVHLKGNKQSKIMKYDPSKYCHNIKRLDDNSLEPIPVSQLTWHLEGGDDEISRKRRGEFPAFKSPEKKKVKGRTYLDTHEIHNTEKCARTPQGSVQATKEKLGSKHTQEAPKAKKPGCLRKRSMNSMSDEEYDSEEELKAALEKEEIAKRDVKYAEDSNIEVVADSFKLSYRSHWAEDSITKERKSNISTQDDNEYDSADTDEIITVAKTVQNCNSVGKKIKIGTLINEKLSIPQEKQNGKRGSTELHSPKGTKKLKEAIASKPESDSQSNDSGTDSSDSFTDEEYESMMQNCYRIALSIGDLEALAKDVNDSKSDDNGENNDSDCDSADTDHIIAATKCVQHDTDVDTSQSENQPSPKRKIKQASKDIQAMKKQKSKDVEVINLDSDHCRNKHSSHSSDSYSDEECKSKKQNSHLVDTTIASAVTALSADDKNDDKTEGEKAETTGGDHSTCDNVMKTVKSLKKKGIEPEDIVASILEDDDDDSSSEQPKRKKKKGTPIKPPAFKGLGSLLSSATPNELQTSVWSLSSSPTKSSAQTTTVIQKSNEVNPGSPIGAGNKKVKLVSDSKGNSVHQDVHGLSKVLKKKLQKVKPKSSSSSSSSDESSSDMESSSTTSSAFKLQVSQNSTSKKQTNSKSKQLQDNQKRLAAMEERRKERELQKQTIQGALLQLDSHSAKKSQHVVFNSESETESEKEEKASTSDKRSAVGDKKAKHVTAKLFESSGEESDDEDEKDDEERFQIKAQYEGRSGEKLMQLQSRFGTDERFKMNSMFLESSSEDEEGTEELQKPHVDDEDDDLSVEKKKNLDILQSLMKINVEAKPVSKKAAQAKKFKDLNALQYDPTKEDHTVFETKAEEEKKESKSERKKKRLEAEKLPEVSKETYHEVTVDLKEVFGTSKSEDPLTTWDQEEESEKVEAESSMSNTGFNFQKTEEPVGFTFSFFGTSAEESVPQDEPYMTEIIKPAKVAWQEDPRFQDSSSEEEEEDTATEVKTSSSALSKINSSVKFFFFVKDDDRLKAGPKMFFRSSKTEEEQEFWEQRRDSLLEECRKRHKDAKRKIKSKQ
ncbi:nucleolar protein 8 [Mixophyes fleayi]|uniref:nucleolar protein 8 n=1 Tax=Mixophyes fleayi TaxID=3061075 RepID=UPI003F4D8685